MKWALVFGIVASTIVCDYLQSSAMKSHGEVHSATVLAKLFGQWRLALSIVFMAISFFCFTQLLAVADLSFAVPATAISFVFETAMAQWVLREQVNWRRWVASVLIACGVA
ncbi:MAG: EamA family transporter, partial [Acidobacteria bacterium]|nr:EamA family transporter [Acidobacteriota bacterium]